MVPLTVSPIVVWGLMVTQVVGLVAPFAVSVSLSCSLAVWFTDIAELVGVGPWTA